MVWRTFVILRGSCLLIKKIWDDENMTPGFKKSNKKEEVSFFNEESSEPRLWEYNGFDDLETKWVYAQAYNRAKDCGCKTCFYRISFIERITKGVLQLRRRGWNAFLQQPG